MEKTNTLTRSQCTPWWFPTQMLASNAQSTVPAQTVLLHSSSAQIHRSLGDPNSHSNATVSTDRSATENTQSVGRRSEGDMCFALDAVENHFAVHFPIAYPTETCNKVREMQARVRCAGRPRDPLRRSRVERAKCRRERHLSGPRDSLRRSRASSARNAGESAICRVPARLSAEIVRVECATCQARVRCVRCLQEPSAEIARVECAKCRRECGGCPRDPLRRSCVSSGQEVENLGSWRCAGDVAVTVARGVAGCKLRTGDFAV